MIEVHEAEGAMTVRLNNGAMLEMEDKGDYMVIRTIGENPSMGAFFVDGRIHITLTTNAREGDAIPAA